ncbi:class C sortase [Microbacterium gorillae]|uniref:class C sortase n=1 Tax=Microbacterium gorillae TaxID=1231063 RepID=UPI003D952C6B
MLRRSWRPSVVTWLLAVLILGGSGLFLYPSTAQWFTSYNQSQVIGNVAELVEDSNPSAAEQLRQAAAYNAALTAGVQVKANSNVPVGNGTLTDGSFDYPSILSMNAQGLMARVKIPAIDVDLPIYHGTSDAVLLEGVGHLEGSSLPIGGPDTHAVLTAHRGLADAAMFTNLDRVKVGDTFTIEVFGEVLTYRVRETKVVAPEDTDALRAVPGEDLVTLVTCTPLGINTHRILVTGERITPTPIEDIAAAGQAPDIPGFPWWAVGVLAAILVAAGYVWWSGFNDARVRMRQAAAWSRRRRAPAESVAA